MVFLTLGLASCDEEYFENDRYAQYIADNFPVDDIDREHDWRTVRTVSATIDLTASAAEVYTVGVFDRNPAEGDSHLLTNAAVRGSATFSFDVPIALGNRVYVQAANGTDVPFAGYYTIGSDNTLNVASTSVSTGVISTAAYDIMEYTFCFEDNFPAPSDYDFNDLVASVKMEKIPAGLPSSTSENDVINLSVTLRALGTTQHVGACMRLVGLSADVLQGEFGNTGEFANNPAVTYTTIVPDNSSRPTTYFTAKNGSDQCIVLFNDGHYAINGGVDLDRENFGIRYYYNTIRESEVDYETSLGVTVSEKTNEYIITFNGSGSQEFNDFTESDIDMFLIESYNSGTYEVHTVPYKQSMVYHEWLTDENIYTDNFPWVLMAPGKIRYASEGNPIGSYTSNVLSGAFQMYGHSFGEWARDHTDATDWYDYPTAAMIYR